MILDHLRLKSRLRIHQLSDIISTRTPPPKHFANNNTGKINEWIILFWRLYNFLNMQIIIRHLAIFLGFSFPWDFFSNYWAFKRTASRCRQSKSTFFELSQRLRYFVHRLLAFRRLWLWLRWFQQGTQI